MKKLMVLAALLVFGTSLIGCKASADVDTKSATSVALRIRSEGQRRARTTYSRPAPAATKSTPIT